MATSGIEKLAASLRLIQQMCAIEGYPNRLEVHEVLVPEQCMTVTMADDMYHVTAVRLTVADERGATSGPDDRASRADAERDRPSKIAFVPADEQALDLLCKMNNIPKPTMLKAAAVVETILGNLMSSDVVTYFGKSVLESPHGLRGYKWDMVVDVARAMDEHTRSQG